MGNVIRGFFTASCGVYIHISLLRIATMAGSRAGGDAVKPHRRANRPNESQPRG